MENAVDALKIAAGVLIALLLTSLIVYVFTAMSKLEDTKDQAELIEQTARFNAQFNAFEKSSMYGTDLISVLSLAYNNNMGVNAGFYKHFDGRYDEDRDGSINIIFKLKTDVQKRRVKRITRYSISLSEIINRTEQVTNNGVIFRKDKKYSLSLNDISQEELENIQNIIINGNDTKIIKSQRRKYDTYIEDTEIIDYATGFSDFKKRIFECIPEETKHDGRGRIKSMTFIEKETN